MSQAGSRRPCQFSFLLSSAVVQSLFLQQWFAVCGQTARAGQLRQASGILTGHAYRKLGRQRGERCWAVWERAGHEVLSPRGPSWPSRPRTLAALAPALSAAVSDLRRAVGRRRGKVRRRRGLIGIHPSVAVLPRIAWQGAPDAAGSPCCPLPSALHFMAGSCTCVEGPRHPVGRRSA